MKKTVRWLPVVSFLLIPLVATAKMAEEKVAYTLDDTRFESVVVYDQDNDDRRPGILMVPNWMGVNGAALEKARNIAGEEYVVMVVDMYGADVRPESSGEASEAAGKLRDDRNEMRARASKALETFQGMAGEVPLREQQIAAIGFCFGGGAVLELGRSGADVDAVVSFHGDLASPTLEADAGDTRAKVLVLHGADDPHVPQEDVQAFIAAMRDTDVDWQFVQFGGAVHSFTNPKANNPGQSQYEPRTAERAFEMMNDLFEEIWD